MTAPLFYFHRETHFSDKLVNFSNLLSRLHSASQCCQLGYTTRGSFKGTRFTSCPNGVPTGREWFEIKVEVIGNIARIYRDDVLTVQTTNHFQGQARCGVIVPNGYSNVVYFKDFVIGKYSFVDSFGRGLQMRVLLFSFK